MDLLKFLPTSRIRSQLFQSGIFIFRAFFNFEFSLEATLHSVSVKQSTSYFQRLDYLLPNPIFIFMKECFVKNYGVLEVIQIFGFHFNMTDEVKIVLYFLLSSTVAP